jgi:hypothetical protein
MSEELLPYLVLKPVSFKGDRIEKGSIIRMTPEEAENIGDEYLEPADEAEEKEEIAGDETDQEESNDNDADDSDEPENKDETEGTETKEGDESSEENGEGTQTDTQSDETV